jgi:mono/diheme cytochrome c family protein
MIVLTLPLAMAFSAGAYSLTYHSSAMRATQAQTLQSSDSGVYTAEQADRGQKTFDANCATCHLTTEYSDNTFKSNWHGRIVFDLFEIIRSTMPQDFPSSLPRNDYVDVVAYILRLNGAPPGKVALPSDSVPLTKIRLEIKRGQLPR